MRIAELTSRERTQLMQAENELMIQLRIVPDEVDRALGGVDPTITLELPWSRPAFGDEI